MSQVVESCDEYDQIVKTSVCVIKLRLTGFVLEEVGTPLPKIRRKYFKF